MNLRHKIRHELFVKRWDMGNAGWISIKDLRLLVPGHSIKEIDSMVKLMSQNYLDQIEWNKSRCFPKYRHRIYISPSIIMSKKEWKSKLKNWFKNIRSDNE